MATMTPAPPAPSFPPAGEAIRYPQVFANLLPDEVVAARDARRLKHRIFIGLAALLGLLLVVWGFTVFQTAHARSKLSSEQVKSITLQNKQRDFAPLVLAQSQSQAIHARLVQLMAGDLQWKDLLATLRSSAPHGVSVTNVAGTLSIGSNTQRNTTGQAGLDVLNQSGKQAVGTLTITGTAPDKNAVAAYIDALSHVAGLTAPFPASVTTSTGKLTFTASVIITSDALGGRYAAGSQGGH